MKKYYTIIGIAGAVLLVTGFMYFSLGGASRGIQKVISNDGLAELAIPKNALPKGVSIKDITMTAIAPADFFKESNRPIDSVKIYRLEPDGLTFSKPATLSAAFPYDPKKTYFPIILAHSKKEGAVESFNVVDFNIDEKKGTLIVSGEVKHFSDYMITIDAGIFTTKHIPEGEITLPVGQSFEHAYVITPGAWEYTPYPYYPDDKDYIRVEVAKGTRWIVHEGSIKTLGRILPEQVILEKRELDAAQEYRENNTFTCYTVGEDRPIVFGGTKIDYTLQLTTGIRTNEPHTTRVDRLGWLRSYIDDLIVNCVAPPSGEAPSRIDATKDTETPATIAPPSAAPKPSGGTIKVCGLPGGEPCPKR